MPPHLTIGLTGGIASGKSTVTQRFRELGVPVVDADEASRAVVAPGTEGLERIRRRFGGSVIAADGRLERSALRNLIFADSAARTDLNAMLHPLIRGYMDQEADKTSGPYVVMAIPLLVEGGVKHDRIDRVLVIDAEEDEQVRRLTARDGSTEAQARAILAVQARRQDRLAAADDVLTNTGNVTQLRQAVNRLHVRYLEFALQKQSLP